MAPQKPRMITALTGIRFFAAIAVVFYHFWNSMLPGVPSNPVVSNGFMGVSLFFILSGYILFYVYLETRDPNVDKKKFWVSRFARVYPVYALALVLEVPEVVRDLIHHHFGIKRMGVAIASLIANITMTQAWYDTVKWKWNPPGWSLSVEAIFYLIFPWLGLWVVRQGTTVRKILLLCAGCIAVSLAPSLLCASLGIGIFERPRPVLFHLVAFAPIFRIPQFLFGMLLARLSVQLRVNHAVEYIERVESYALAGGVVLLIAVLAMADHIPYLVRYVGAADLAFGAIIFGLANAKGILARALSLPWLVSLGEASYSVYILQVPVWSLFLIAEGAIGFTPTLESQLQNAIAFGTYFVILVAASLVCFKYFETPIRRAIVQRYASDHASAKMKVA